MPWILWLWWSFFVTCDFLSFQTIDIMYMTQVLQQYKAAMVEDKNTDCISSDTVG